MHAGSLHNNTRILKDPCVFRNYFLDKETLDRALEPMVIRRIMKTAATREAWIHTEDSECKLERNFKISMNPIE